MATAGAVLCQLFVRSVCLYHQCLESVGQVLSDDSLLEAEQTIELLVQLSQYQTQWRLSLSASLQLLMVGL